MTQPNQSNKKPTRNVSRVGDVTSLYHTEGHEQELREQLLGMAVMVCHSDEPQRINGTFNFIDIEALVTAHTNAEIARTLDRIASKKNIYVKHAEYVTELNEPPLVITTDYKYMIDLGAIQAERAKLKEVK